MSFEEKVEEIRKINKNKKLSEEQKTILAGLYASLSLNKDYLNFRNKLQLNLIEEIKNDKSVMF